MKRKIFESTNFHPIWLPQMRCGYDYVMNCLNGMGVDYNVVNVSPNDLHTLQSGVSTDSVNYFDNKIKNLEPVDPIYISKDNEILDGHHRFFGFKQNPNVEEIVCIKILLDKQDAARVLNKIQDKFNWENEIDSNNNDDSLVKGCQCDGDCRCDVKKSIKLYRSKPIQENSKTGNFFLMEKAPRFNHEYEIEFDNLYEISDEDCGNDPIGYLSEMWFGDVNTIKENAIRSGLTFENFLNRKIVEEARKRGYDGIKYGNKYIQTV